MWFILHLVDVSQFKLSTLISRLKTDSSVQLPHELKMVIEALSFINIWVICGKL